MMKWICFGMILFSTGTALAEHSCTDEQYSKLASKGLPAGTREIIARITSCNHWGGEVGDTSPERTKEIDEAVKKDQCDALQKDREAFIKRHSKSTKLPAVFTAADSWDGKCAE
jgi:hypothetical protein